MKKLNNSSGYIALLAVIIVGAAATASALAIISLSADNQLSSSINQEYMQDLQAAEACAEESLQVIHDNTSYTGTGSLSISTANCSYTVTNLGGTSRRIDISSTENNVVRKIQIYATINSTSISITSWQDVS